MMGKGEGSDLLVLVFLLDDISGDGAATIGFWRRPFQIDKVIVVVSNFRSSRLSRLIWNFNVISEFHLRNGRKKSMEILAP